MKAIHRNLDLTAAFVNIIAVDKKFLVTRKPDCFLHSCYQIKQK